LAYAGLLAVLAFGHVLSAMGWLGGGILTTFVVGPNVLKLSPAARLEFNAKVMPRILRFVQVMVGSTFLFGLLLLYFVFDGDFSRLTSGNFGLELTAGMIVALVTSAVVVAVTGPSFRQVSKIASETLESGKMPPPPELMMYGKRARLGSLLGIGLLLVVLALMISAGFGFF